MSEPSESPQRRALVSGVDDGADIPRDMVVGIYERIQQRELRSNEDHVTYVSKVEQSIVGMKSVGTFQRTRFFFCFFLARNAVSLYRLCNFAQDYKMRIRVCPGFNVTLSESDTKSTPTSASPVPVEAATRVRTHD